jgi:hypothetical protein
MSLPPPQYPVDHLDYSAACREALDGRLQDLIDEAVRVGWNEKEAANAVEELARLRLLAHQRPDAADDHHPLPAVSDFPVD